MPLPLDYYNEKQWQDVLLQHYSKTHPVLPSGALEKPLELITDGVKRAVFIWGQVHEHVCNILNQTIDPLYSSEEYYKQIYEGIIAESDEKGVWQGPGAARALLKMRRIYEQDVEFLQKELAGSIKVLSDAGEAEPVNKLAVSLRTILQAHVKQISGLIMRHKRSEEEKG